MLSTLAVATLLTSLSTLARANYFIGDEISSMGIGDTGLGGGGNLEGTSLMVQQEGSECNSGYLWSCNSDSCYYGTNFFSIKNENTGEAYDLFLVEGTDKWNWYFSGAGYGGDCYPPSGDEGKCDKNTATYTLVFKPYLKCYGDVSNY